MNQNGAVSRGARFDPRRARGAGVRCVKPPRGPPPRTDHLGAGAGWTAAGRDLLRETASMMLAWRAVVTSDPLTCDYDTVCRARTVRVFRMRADRAGASPVTRSASLLTLAIRTMALCQPTFIPP